jgi:hypothetical protein
MAMGTHAEAVYRSHAFAAAALRRPRRWNAQANDRLALLLRIEQGGIGTLQHLPQRFRGMKLGDPGREAQR